VKSGDDNTFLVKTPSGLQKQRNTAYKSAPRTDNLPSHTGGFSEKNGSGYLVVYWKVVVITTSGNLKKP